MSNPM